MNISERRRPRRRAALIVLFLCILGAPAAESGGIRVINRPPGQVTGTVDIVIYFTYDPATTFGRTQDQEVAEWTPVFDRFSRLLLNATDQQLQIGNRRFTFDISESAFADVWIYPTVDDETAIPGGVNNFNQWMSLYQQTKCTDANQNQDVCAQNPRVRGAYSILHEAGHYYWSLQDEYEGVCMQRDRATGRDATCMASTTEPFYFCAATVVSKICCIMDYNARDGNRNRRSEFCISNVTTEYQHQSTYQDLQGRCVTNLQESAHGFSCWDTMGGIGVDDPDPDASLRITRLPDGASPVNEPAGGLTVPGGTTTIVDGKPGFILVLDNSASMEQRDLSNDNLSRQELAQLGAINALDTMRDDETVGIISFNSGTTTLLQAERENVGANQVAARDAINNMPAPSGWTDLGSAIQAAIGQLQGLGNPGPGERQLAQKSIILLSDGKHTLGTLPGVVLPAINGAADMVVHTIAFGPDADVAGLQEIAQRTGGTFFAAEDAADQMGERGRLALIFPKILAAARGETVTAEATGTVQQGRVAAAPVQGSRKAAQPGEFNRVTIPVTIDSFTGAASFILSYAPESIVPNPPHLELRLPSGARIFTEDPDNDTAEGAEACWESADGMTKICGGELVYVRNTAQRLYRVPNRFIEPGTWELEVSTTREAGDAVASDDFSILVLAEQRTVSVSAEVVNPPPVRYPEPILVRATVVAGFRVAGAEVTARVLLPGGAVDNIVLHDDGRPENGDVQENDGVYSAKYFNYKSADQSGGSGVHVFKIKVINVDGFEGVSVDRDPTLRIPVSPFTAEAEACAFVTLVPTSISPGTAAMGSAVIGSPPTPVPNPDVRAMSVGNWVMMPVLNFALTTANEYVKLRSLVVGSTGTGDESTLGQLWLFLDGNKDGTPDNPTRPLARASFQQDDDPMGAVFRPAGPKVALPPGTHNFIITAGPLRPPFRPEATPALRPSTAAFVVPPPLFWGTLVALFAVLFWVALRNLQLPEPARVALTSACLVFAVVMTGAIGCGNGGTQPMQPTTLGGPTPPQDGTYNMSLSPADIVATGATTRLNVNVLGPSIESDVTYVPVMMQMPMNGGGGGD